MVALLSLLFRMLDLEALIISTGLLPFSVLTEVKITGS